MHMALIWLFFLFVSAITAVYNGIIGDIEPMRYFTILTLLSYIIFKLESIFVIQEEE